MGSETFIVTKLADNSPKNCSGVALRLNKCPNKCAYILSTTNEDASVVTLALCKDCIVEYLRNLLKDGYWKLDKATFECHY